MRPQHKSKLSPHSSRLLAFEKTVQESMFMLWDGNRQIQEYTDKLVFTTVYEQDSFVPVARLVAGRANKSKSSDNQEIKIYHYHTDHLGVEPFYKKTPDREIIHYGEIEVTTDDEITDWGLDEIEGWAF